MHVSGIVKKNVIIIVSEKELTRNVSLKSCYMISWIFSMWAFPICRC